MEDAKVVEQQAINFSSYSGVSKRTKSRHRSAVKDSITCYICILISVVNTYVLLAANLEDFRNLAKKLVPSKISDQIADIALRSIKTQDTSPNYKVKYDRRGNDKDDLPNYNGEDAKQTRFSIKQQEAINIDDIVDKVKNKLEKQFHEKYEANLTALQKILEKNRIEKLNRNQIKKNNENIDYAQDYTPKELSQPKRGARPAKSKPSYVQKDEETPSIVDDTKTFSKIKIGKAKDSYEDYVIPEKDDYSDSSNTKNPSNHNIGRHDDSIVIKPKQNFDRNRQRDGDSIGTNIKSNEDIYNARGLDSIGTKSKQNFDRNRERDGDSIGTEIKLDEDRHGARDFDPIGSNPYIEQERSRPKDDTERDYESVYANSKLKIDNKSEQDSVETKTKQNPHEIQFDNIKAETENLFYEDLATEGTKRSFKNTMIPTKRFFKFSSPNYYAQLPTVVEKYDFEEPLPEKDREKEDIKYIPNPPAKINGKIGLGKYIN